MEQDEILAHLIALPSIFGTGNAAIVDWIVTYARACGAEVTVAMGPEGDRANLLITVGPRFVPGLVLSGHMDVVPANEPDWLSDPFTMRAEHGRLYGRGTSDMKGFLACALAALPELAKRPLTRPVHLAFSYDEEAGCRGVPHLLALLPDLCALPQACIVGEPSGLRAIRAHKGKAAAHLEVRGRAGHSSRPDQGLNAVHAMASVLSTAVDAARALTNGPFESAFEPPYSSLQVGMIHGGQAINIIPDHCSADIEARAISGQSPVVLLDPIRQALADLDAQGFETSWTVTSQYPALSLAEDAPLAAMMAEITGQAPLAAVSYGTEAGLYQAAGIPAIICGPGDIARAHRANEYIERDELSACRRMIDILGQRMCA